MSSSDEASSDSDAEGDTPPRPPPRRRERAGRGAPPPAMGNLPLKAPKEDGSGGGEDDGDDDRSPRSMRDGGRMSKRREGLSISGDQGGDVPPLQEEARSKVKQAIVVSFGPEDPKGCGKTHLLRHVYSKNDRFTKTGSGKPSFKSEVAFFARVRQEMLMMLQFVQTLQDLEMFVQKYQDDLVRANAHTPLAPHLA